MPIITPEKKESCLREKETSRTAKGRTTHLTFKVLTFATLRVHALTKNPLNILQLIFK